MIIGSGNVVHNLRAIKWEDDAEPFDWAVEFDRWIKEKLEKRDFESLISDFNQTTAGQRSVPTAEHYFPLLYVFGASHDDDRLQTHFEGIQNGSVSMRSFSFGAD